jgi:superfamily II DNA or RNA helicase
MLPSAALEYEFKRVVRLRGTEYALRGAVEILSGTDSSVLAFVHGTDTYVVGITRVVENYETRFDMTCSCPYVADRWEPCKHLWATLRAAEDAGHLGGTDGAQAAPGATYVHLLELDADRADAPDPEAAQRPGARRRPGGASVRRTPQAAAAFLQSVHQRLSDEEAAAASTFPYLDAPLQYVLEEPAPGLSSSPQPVLHVMHQRRMKNGTLGVLKPAKLAETDIAIAPAADRAILAQINGSRPYDPYTYLYRNDARRAASFALSDALALHVLPEIAREGRLWLRESDRGNPVRLMWDDGPSWSFRPVLAESGTGIHVEGELHRGAETAPITEPFLILADRLIVRQGTMARFEGGARLALLSELQRSGPMEIPSSEAPVLAHVLARMDVPAESLPERLRITAVRVPPTPRLSIAAPPAGASWLRARLEFAYDHTVIPASETSVTPFDAGRRRIVHRRPEDEARARTRLADLGFRAAWQNAREYELRPNLLAETVRALVAEGWHVEADGSTYRASTAVRMAVNSGIDWFDLTTTVEFGDTTVAGADVIAALRSGSGTVRLGDGTIGVLPEDWLRRHATLAAAGQVEGDAIRFGRPQAALLDALLADRAADAAVSVDRAFEKVRQELATFSQVEPIDPPETFTGALRPYQRDGLGWFGFLRRFGFGGCLADDMGLGKTVMVLALLESRRLLPPDPDRPHRPSLVVVPRSLVGNWIAEAAAFTPALRVLDHSRGSREWDPAVLADVDLVLATYGTLRRDIAAMAKLTFDYAVLDEAQAIKNAKTSAAKAARLLRADHRLALSGTPIENHLGELWSLFDFLNPGVLGRSSAFQRATTASGDGTGGSEAATVLSRGLRPFILRRTKQQVARDLPERTEQTITCELSPKERALYDGLRRHYREVLLDRVERVGLGKSRLQVLEALLRLRQAACHPALVEPAKRAGGSTKFDVLLPRLREVLDEGHKALVFSQFTTLLGLLRSTLDAEGMTYEYLDGKTTNREAHVRRFQHDPAIGLFLISLKAGGVGLNLTAAEYVFLLDPWWNPAVEAQAIDRAHRIGQTREVFAYRLIAKDTVEEKVLALQQSKRALADAVLSADAVGLRHLERADLELLLS